ncbi:hypothetical protein ACKWTF_015437 [Chironomus riparius]
MNKKPWREAATLIVFARDPSSRSNYDYKILIFTRTLHTSVRSKNLSFPGGSLDPSDESLSWTSFFKHHKVPSEKLRRRTEVTKPFIYDPQGNNKIEREISLRLAAIRETFEELGIALCSPASDSSKSSPFTDYFHSKDCDIPFWQKQVHNSQETFMNFCDQFGVVPNIMGIYEWSVWMSPVFSLKRFETAVFVTFLESIPPCYPESYEVQNFMWMTPEEAITAHHQKLVWVPPPLFYEIHRFINHKSIDEIAAFAKARNGSSVPLIHPVSYSLKDSYTFVYPGDDLYPKDVSFYKQNYDPERFKDKTFEELENVSKNLCRIKLEKFMFGIKMCCNTDDGLLPARSLMNKAKL